MTPENETKLIDAIVGFLKVVAQAIAEATKKGAL